MNGQSRDDGKIGHTKYRPKTYKTHKHNTTQKTKRRTTPSLPTSGG